MMDRRTFLAATRKGIRASPSVRTTLDEIDRFCEAA